MPTSATDDDDKKYIIAIIIIVTRLITIVMVMDGYSSDTQTYTTVLNLVISHTVEGGQIHLNGGWPDSPQCFDSLMILEKFN